MKSNGSWPARVLALALLAGAGAGAGSPAAGAADADRERVIPSERCRGLWLVTLEYREGPEGGLVMVLDTGAGETSVDPESIERVFGRRIGAGRRVTLKDGTAGPLQLHKLKVRVHDMDHLSGALGRELDGILGFAVFESVLLTLDYPANEVRVGRGKLPRVDGSTIFRDVGRGRPFIAVEVGAATPSVLIDSGSVGGLRLHPADALEWSVEPRPVGAAVGYDEIRLYRAGRLAHDLRIGPLDVERPVVRVWDGTRLIGAPVMERFAWTFDQRSRRVRMLPDRPAPIHSDPERGMGAAFKPVDAGLEVVRVFDGSPAARADLREGDLVLAVDGVPIDERDCDPGIQGSDRDHVVLTIRRDGAERDVTVDIVDLVP